MATVDSLIAQLQQAVDRIRQAVEQVRGARSVAKECQTRSHALGVPGVARRFQAIADRADDLERMLLAGIDAVERLIAQAEATRHGTGTAGVVPVASTPEPAQPPPAVKGPSHPWLAAAVRGRGARARARSRCAAASTGAGG